MSRESKLIDCICDCCGKIFKRRLGRINANKRTNSKNYCSPECYSIGRTKGKIVNCEWCNKEVYKTQYVISKSKSGAVFCSHRCSRLWRNQKEGIAEGKDSNNYKDGRSSYRKKALKYYNNKCSVCGYDILQVLVVHHKDCNRKNNDIENLDILCPNHHKEYHLGLRNYNNE